MKSSNLHSGRRAKDFYTWTAPRPLIEFRGATLRMPVFFHRTEAFHSLHLAAHVAVRDILPCEDLYPIRWFDGRAILGFGAFRHEHVSVDHADGASQMMAPYGEIGVVVMISRGRSRAKGLGMLQAALGSGGQFILDLPVTTAEARDAGRAVYGMPKFVADMDFTEEPGHRTVELWEQDAHILTMEVRTHGPARADRKPTTLYSVHDGQLIETVTRFQGHRQTGMGAAAGTLVLGEHPVADRLRALGVATEPLIVDTYLDARIILPTGTPVGVAREYVGHLGLDRERGRLTVSYPGTSPIDLYAIPPGLRQSVGSSERPG